jgi:hypothetical protein
MHSACYEHWEHRRYFESVVRKRNELWDGRPCHLKLTADEIKSLSKEDRARFWNEVDAWSRTMLEDLTQFLALIGPPWPGANQRPSLRWLTMTNNRLSDVKRHYARV